MARHGAAYALQERYEQGSTAHWSARPMKAGVYAYDGKIDPCRDDDVNEAPRMVPGWWIVPGALLGAAFWYGIVLGVLTLLG